MKKRKFLGIFMSIGLLLSSCNNKTNSNSVSEPIYDDDPIQMRIDNASDYTYAESTNKNGSMNYEIFVRSFYDSNGDGVGDLNGVKAKLPYIADMGYKTIWLMPIFLSGSYHGYDVIDYYKIDGFYGSLTDFDSLVEEAKKYNIDIMLDMVLNHCSIKNKYFTQALADYKSDNTSSDSKKDWFNFGPGGDHVIDGITYESKFDASMPDFNLNSTGVRNEIENIVKFWIGHGVKGFRLDAVLYYYSNNRSKNIEFLNWLADTCHKYDQNFYMVGEAWTSNGALDSYFTSKCDSFFDFSTATGGDSTCANIIQGYGRASTLSSNIAMHENYRKQYNPNSYTSYFLSNHDQDRIAKVFKDENQYKAACSFYSLLPGTSYTYYGEEIALKGTRVTYPDDQSDVRRRLPMIWSENDTTGLCKFPETNRQDLNKNDQVTKGVDDLKKEPFSLLNHYKMMIHLRNKYSWIKHSIYKDLTKSLKTDENSVMAYSLEYGENKIVVVHNFASHNVEVTAPGTEILDQINTTHKIPELNDGLLKLGANSSVILKQ